MKSFFKITLLLGIVLHTTIMPSAATPVAPTVPWSNRLAMLAIDVAAVYTCVFFHELGHAFGAWFQKAKNIQIHPTSVTFDDVQPGSGRMATIAVAGPLAGLISAPFISNITRKILQRWAPHLMKLPDNPVDLPTMILIQCILVNAYNLLPLSKEYSGTTWDLDGYHIYQYLRNKWSGV